MQENSIAKRFSLFIVVNALSLFVVDKLMSSMYIGSPWSLLILTIIFGVLNSCVKPVLKLLSLPITILTLGLFSLVINGAVLKLAFALVGNATLNGLFNSIIAAILLSIANTIFYNLFD